MATTATRKRATKRKRSTATRTPSSVVSAVQKQVNYAAIGQQQLGWDSRITLYVTPKEAQNYTNHKAFASQIRGPFTVDGYVFTELGAFRDDYGDKRIVEVKVAG